MNLRALPKLELLQVIRAIAALAVVFYHSGYQPDYGAYGVEVFFVLSGVVMAMLMQTEASPLLFSARRIIRIVPLYWTMTTIAAFLIWLMPGDRVSARSGNIVEYLQSLFFIPYFNSGRGLIVPMLNPGWTLNYEMTFYFSCAFALFLSRKYSSYLALFVVLFWWLMAALSTSAIGLFYQRPIVLYFLAGILLWQFDQLVKLRFNSRFSLILIPIICVFLSLLDFWEKRKISTSYSEFLKIFFVIFIVWLGLACEESFQKIKETFRNILIEIGDSSYAIYLTHLFVIHLLFIFSKKIGLTRHGIFLAIISIILSTIIGILVHRYFDLPIQKKLKRLIPKN